MISLYPLRRTPSMRGVTDDTASTQRVQPYQPLLNLLRKQLCGCFKPDLRCAVARDTFNRKEDPLSYQDCRRNWIRKAKNFFCLAHCNESHICSCIKLIHVSIDQRNRRRHLSANYISAWLFVTNNNWSEVASQNGLGYAIVIVAIDYVSIKCWNVYMRLLLQRRLSGGYQRRDKKLSGAYYSLATELYKFGSCMPSKTIYLREYMGRHDCKLSVWKQHLPSRTAKN